MFQISRHCLPFAHQPLVSHMTLQLNIIFFFSKLKSCNQPVFANQIELFSSPIFSPLCPHISPLCSPHRPCTLLQVTSLFCNLVLSCQIYCIFVYTSKRQKDHVSTTMGTKILVPRTLKKKENNIVIVG